MLPNINGKSFHKESLKNYIKMARGKSSQISFIGLVISKDFLNGQVGCGCEFLSGVMCAGGMGCWRICAIWVQQGTGTSCRRPKVF